MAKCGYSRRGLFGTMTYYDNNGHKIGESNLGLFGSMMHYDSNHKKHHIECQQMQKIKAERVCSVHNFFEVAS